MHFVDSSSVRIVWICDFGEWRRGCGLALVFSVLFGGLMRDDDSVIVIRWGLGDVVREVVVK